MELSSGDNAIEAVEVVSLSTSAARSGADAGSTFRGARLTLLVDILIRSASAGSAGGNAKVLAESKAIHASCAV